MTSGNLADRLDFARDAARDAGALTLVHFRSSDLAVEQKQDMTPVTIADRGAEQLLRERIGARFPSDGVLGEEFGETAGNSGFRWILDPIDGTKSFVCGVPLYGTLIGLEHEGRSVLGIIHLPALDEMIWAAAGQGAWQQRGAAKPVAARVSCRSKLADGVFCTSDVAGFGQVGRQAAYEAMQKATRLSRTWGDCFGYALVATGRADVMIDPIMSIWDAAALQPILEEAGGTFTDWRGVPTIHSGEGVATNGILLPEVLAVLKAAGA
jgi:histidinol phosphatase-like enzyme (inositol monophosphatase family)